MAALKARGRSQHRQHLLEAKGNMTATIVITTAVGSLLILAQPARAARLAHHIPLRAALLASVGTSVEVLGLNAGGIGGRACLVCGIVALLGAAWPLRHWPGGWTLLSGVALNGLAMVVYGRMPLSPAALEALHVNYPLGTVLWGSKDIVVQGLVAQWLGDRFVLDLPLVETTTVWSVGDVLLLMGIFRAATVGMGRQALRRIHVQRS
jgi:hypothetical protein